MRRFFRKKPQTELTPEQLLDELQQCRVRSEFFLSATVSFLSCIKEFAHGYSEVNSEAFTAQMERLKQQCRTTKTTAMLQRQFQGQPEQILDFITREKAYLQEREQELKNVIDMLHAGLSAMYGDNQVFNDTVQERSLRVERLTNLDDIRRIKEQVKAEVTQLKTAIHQKQVSDSQRVDKLTREVALLRQNLERVTDVSQTDPLTGVFNRLAFNSTLHNHIDRYQLSRTRFTLLLCDLDNFKAINDTFGHQIGDRVLISFTRECRDFFREQDFIFRYGGEEFAVILPHSSLRHATKRAQNFCKQLAAKRYVFDETTLDRAFKFTVSIGVSEIHPQDTLETLVERADQALYLAKRQGKNRAMSEQDVTRLAPPPSKDPSVV